MSLVHRGLGKLGHLLRLRLESRPGFIWRVAIAFLAWFVRLHAWTLRHHIHDEVGYLNGSLDRPVIILLWHDRIFSMPAFYERFRRRKKSAVVLTSASREGSLLAMLLAWFGMGAVRGSTSRRASGALRELAAQIDAGHDVFITPDGPRGPRHRVQPGALFLARKTGCPLLPVTVEYSRSLQLKTWDRFILPFPFARMRVTIHHPVTLSMADTAEALENDRVRVEQILAGSLLME